MRYFEYALLSVPLCLAALWLYGVRGLSRTGMIIVVAILLLFAAALYWVGEGRSFTGHYVPAHLRNGTIESGHPG